MRSWNRDLDGKNGPPRLASVQFRQVRHARRRPSLVDSPTRPKRPDQIPAATVPTTPDAGKPGPVPHVDNSQPATGKASARQSNARQEARPDTCRHQPLGPDLCPRQSTVANQPTGKRPGEEQAGTPPAATNPGQPGQACNWRRRQAGRSGDERSCQGRHEARSPCHCQGR